MRITYCLPGQQRCAVGWSLVCGGPLTIVVRAHLYGFFSALLGFDQGSVEGTQEPLLRPDLGSPAPLPRQVPGLVMGLVARLAPLFDLSKRVAVP